MNKTATKTDPALSRTPGKRSDRIALTHAGFKFERWTKNNPTRQDQENDLARPWICELSYKSHTDSGETVGCVVSITRRGVYLDPIGETDAAGAELIGKAMQAASILSLQLKSGTRNFLTGELSE